MSNPFVSSSSFAESGSTQVEVHHQLGHNGDAPPLASGVVNGSTQLPQLDLSSADNGGSVGGPGTATGSWVQFEESGGSETTATATATATQQQASQKTTEGADLQTPPRSNDSSSPQGGKDGFSSISANSAGAADQKEPSAAETAAAADSNHFATIELSHSIEISHPQSATHLKQQQQQQQPPSSSATAGGHLLKVQCS